MKTSTTITHPGSISEHPHHDLEKELMIWASVKGEEHGMQNKPTKEHEFKVLFLNKIESQVQGEIDKNNATFLPVSGMVVAKKILGDAEDTARPLSARLRDKELELRTLQQQKKSFAIDKRKRLIRWLVYLAAAVIAVTEGLFSYPGFRHIPLPPFPAGMAALGISIAVGIGTHILAGYIVKSATTRQYIRRLLVCSTPACVGFIVLGNLRATGFAASRISLDVTQATPSDQGTSSVWITIISILLWLAALLFSMRYRITPEEAHRETQYNKACDELAECEEKMHLLRNSVQAIRHDAHEKSAEALRNYERAISTEQSLQTLAKQVTEEYISKNLNYRKDTVIPSFFSEPPPFQFRLFFDNLKKQKA